MIHPLRLRGAYFLPAAILVGAAIVVISGRIDRDAGLGAVGEHPADPGPPPASASATADVFLDARRQQLIGVRMAPVVRSAFGADVEAVGVIRYDENRVTDFNLKLEGWIRDLYVSYVGQRVMAGQPLCTIYSQELDSLQNSFVAALKAREQTPNPQVADAGAFADRLVGGPRQRLRQWDVAEDELRALEQTRQLPAAVTFRSPIGGVVIEKSVTKGMHVEPGQTLYRIADLSVVLVEADFRELDAHRLDQGASVEITLDALPGERFSGRILSTYPFISEQTRTLKARIQLQNRHGRFKPGMFANVRLDAKKQTGLLVPIDAVVDSGASQIVFVAKGNGYFEPRAVTVGARADGHALILQGLQENEQVVDRATFFIDSESQMRTALKNYATTPQSAVPKPAAPGVNFIVQVSPDPPRTGENIVEVRLSGTDGRPITDADLRVSFSMPAMPAMNMPAMGFEPRLLHVSGGLYRGLASISMAGRWDVTVTAERNGRRVGSTHSTILVR